MKLSAIKSNVYISDKEMLGTPIQRMSKTLNDLKGYFCDERSYSQMDPNTVVYNVDIWMPVAEGEDGGLFFGITTLSSGLVGSEYFMTKGHFHAKANRAEFYWGIKGKGILLLMDQNRKSRAELVEPNSLHYIPGFVAHRLINIDKIALKVGACWGSDAGHNYSDIIDKGFSARVMTDEKESHIIINN